MKKDEVMEQMHQIIQSAVERSGGDWRRGYRREVEAILTVIGKLTPEPNSGNIRTPVPNYNSHLIKRAKPKRLNISPELAAKAKEIMRKMGMLR